MLNMRRRKLARNILIQTASKTDVQQLAASANSQYRQLHIAESYMQKTEIKIRAFIMRELDAIMLLLTISARAIIIATDEHNSIETPQKIRQVSITAGWNQYRNSTRIADRLIVKRLYFADLRALAKDIEIDSDYWFHSPAPCSLKLYTPSREQIMHQDSTHSA
jgi:hypothetical protein